MWFIGRKTFLFLIFCFPYLVVGESTVEQLLGLSSSESGFVSCEELTDGFCETLYSAENRGNFQFPDGTQILAGEKRQHIISNASFIYYQKLAESRCRFPEDVKIQMGIHCGEDDEKTDLLARLNALLSEVDSIGQDSKSVESWRRTGSQIISDVNFVITNVAYERTFKDSPHLSEKLRNDWTFHDRKTSHENYYSVHKEIMDAVYLNDPDWQRVVRVFKEARQDVLRVLERMDLNPETKDFMKAKVNAVKLSLPYMEKIETDNIKDCATFEIAAYYISSSNTVFICMGQVNTSLNEGNFYVTAAHEIAHSIDPGTFLLDIFKQTPMAHLLKELYETHASLDCDDWEERKNEIFVFPSEIYQLLQEKFNSLDQCLVDRQDHRDINHQSLEYVSVAISKRAMAHDANTHTFSYLTTVEIFKAGVLRNNEFYLEPRLLEESRNRYQEVRHFQQGFFHDLSVFVQEYRCHRLSGSDREEEEVFAESLEETHRLRDIYEYELANIVGRNSRKLAAFKLSKPSHEDFADWISYKALELKLRRIPSIGARRAFLISGIYEYCKSEDLDGIASRKRLTEREYRIPAPLHPLWRYRRLRAFTPKIADLLKCSRGEEIISLDRNCDAVIFK